MKTVWLWTIQSLALSRLQPPVSALDLVSCLEKGHTKNVISASQNWSTNMTHGQEAYTEAFFPSAQNIFLLSLSPTHFLYNVHTLSLSQPREVEDNINKKKCIENQHKVILHTWVDGSSKGPYLPATLLFASRTVCPRKKRRANPGSRSFPKGSFFLSLQPGAFAWDSVLWADSFFKLSHWFFTFVGSWKKNEAVGWGRDSILPG